MTDISKQKIACILLAVAVITGCTATDLSQESQTPIPEQTPTPTTTSSPVPVNLVPQIDKINITWTGGDKDQPWTCSHITFEVIATDPDGIITEVKWYTDGSFGSMGSSFTTQFKKEGEHTIEVEVTDDDGSTATLRQSIYVKYEVLEPIPIRTKNGLGVFAIYAAPGVAVSTHPENEWHWSDYTPVEGYYDLTDPVTVDWHIKWMVEHGITNVEIVTWVNGTPPSRVSDSSYMIWARDGFLNAKYRDMIKVSVMLDM